MKVLDVSVCLVGLVLTSVRAGDVSALLERDREWRRLGSVQTEVGSTNWLEFNSNQSVGSLAYGCSVNCSNATNSVRLGNNSAPWTFNTTNCTTLWVMQGYGTGDSIWTVSDNNAVLGDTSLGINGTTCQSAPNVCFQNLTSTGYGSWNLTAGSHSVSIRVTRQDKPVDAGWFRINVRTCPTSPTAPTGPSKPPTKAPTKAPSTPTKPTKPTKKPTAPSPPSPPSPGGRCWAAQRCAQEIIQKQRLCKCNPIFAGKRQCVRNKAVNLCCPNASRRPADYQAKVFAQARFYCNPF
jgi:hypothetical protein